MRKQTLFALLLLLVAGFAGCGQKNSRSDQPAQSAENPPPAIASTEGPAPVVGQSADTQAATEVNAQYTAPAVPPVQVPAGTTLRVRLNQSLDTRRNRAGDGFSATLDSPVVVGSNVVVPRGTEFHGRVVAARPSGRLKGRAALSIRLDSFQLNGQKYQIQTTGTLRVSGNHKKRNLGFIGGGSGFGALVGGIAGGGPAALIGAGAGAAAGTAGAVITGKRNVHMPAESVLTFSLRSPVNVGS